MNKKELIFQQILDLAIKEGDKAVDKYLKDHINDKVLSVGWGNVYVLEGSEFANWYRNKMKTNIIEGGGSKYDEAILWAKTIESILQSFGVKTKNDVHLD